MVKRTRIFSEYDMYDYVYNNLRSRYPESSGWELAYQPHYNYNSYIPDFVVQRYRNGTVQKIVAEVKLDSYIYYSYIEQLNEYVRKLSGGNGKIIKKFLVLPCGVDNTLVKEYNDNQFSKRSKIEIMYLKCFKCESDGIWWYYQN